MHIFPYIVRAGGLADMKLRIWGELAPDYLDGSNIMAKVLVRRRREDWIQRQFRDRRESFNKPPVPEPHPRPSQSEDLGMGPRPVFEPPGSRTTALEKSSWAVGTMMVVGGRDDRDRWYISFLKLPSENNTNKAASNNGNRHSLGGSKSSQDQGGVLCSL